MIVSNTIPNRLIALLEWGGIWILGSMGSITARVWVLSIAGSKGSPLDFNPWGDLIGMFQIAPFGWMLLGWIGPLWMVIGGLAGSLITKQRWWHLLTWGGTIWFGILWPQSFWAWMSV